MRQRWIDIQLGKEVSPFSDGARLESTQTQSMAVVKQWDFFPEKVFKELFPDESTDDMKDAWFMCVLSRLVQSNPFVLRL